MVLHGGVLIEFAEAGEPFAQLGERRGHLLVALHRGGHLERPAPLRQLLPLGGPLGLPLERANLPTHLAEHVGDAKEVLTGLLEPALRGLALILVAGDAGGLLDDEAALLRPGRDDEADAALLDDGVGLARADAGAEEELLHVAEPDLAAVEFVFAFAVAVEAAGDLDFCMVAEGCGDIAAVVLHRERDLRHAHRTVGLGAGEDELVHALAAQVFGRLRADAPLDGVDDVALSTAVGPHDGCDAVADLKPRLGTEGLEAHEFDAEEFHRPVR